MGITFIAPAVANDLVGGTTITLGVPAGTLDGDFMIAVVWGVGGAGAPAVPAGWSDASPGGIPHIDAAFNSSGAMFRFASSEPASYVFTFPTARSPLLGYICTYRGLSHFLTDIKQGEVVGAPPQVATRPVETNTVGAGDLLIHQPMMGVTQFGTLVTITPDAALNRRADIPAIGATGLEFQRLTATDEIYNAVANFPARTLTVDNTIHLGNIFGLNTMFRPIAAQTDVPGFGFGQAGAHFG